ncbi:MAG: WecB/TagA/CpsF family glycosyltransferase, partial [Dehalococcoidia bacterium]|nr:WecB/TagA/CpsF family glycosyltransferase [Dehalococcoidia bacterium]
MDRELNILGVRVNNLTESEVLEHIEAFVRDGTSHQIVTVNPEFVIMAQQERDFRDILNKADLALPDGVGILWASRMLGKPLRERVAGSDLVERLAWWACSRGYSLYLLGAGPGVAQQA